MAASSADASKSEAPMSPQANQGVKRYSQHTLMFLQVCAGAAAGAVAKTATGPLERIKILFQIQGMQGRDLVNPKYRGILQTAWVVTKEEGFLALWKGNGANVLRVIPVYGLKFGFNDTFKAIVAGPEKKVLTTSQLLWVGTLAGLFQTTLTYPLETVRTRLSIGPGQGVQYKGITDCFKQMLRTEGVPGLFKGFGPTMLSGAPYTGIQMTTYELLKRFSQPYVQYERKRSAQGGSTANLQSPYGRMVPEAAVPYISPLFGNVIFWQLFNGAMSGLVAQSVTYPGDTVRRRMQTNGAGGAERIYRNSIHCCKLIIQNEGYRGFFKGAWTNTVRAVPGAAVQFAAYEFFRDLLKC